MTIRLVTDGRGSLQGQIVRKLVSGSGGRIVNACHFGDRDSDFHAACLQRMEVRYGLKGHLMNINMSRGAHIPLLASPDFHFLLEQCVEQLHRNSPFYRYRSHNLAHLQDYLDYFHILADAFAQQLEDSGATHVLFLNMPHLGYDIILYHVAKSLGLKTLICSHAFFPDCFFSMESIPDFGHLSPDGQDAPPFSIEKGSAPYLFYIDIFHRKSQLRNALNVKSTLSLFKHLAFRRPKKLFDPVYLFGILLRMRAINRRLPDWRDPFAKFFHVNELAYFEHLLEYDKQPVDFNVKFVYIPLHLQPEMTTQTLGGEFRDQLLVVEAIARLLPTDWLIYVKENPSQTSYARGPMFFHRLSRIRNVQLVPSDTSSHQLSSGAQITATVCGTAGYEALCKGKPVIIFGESWYANFPGVFRWHESLSLESVAATRFSHESLEQSMGSLLGRSHKGIIDLYYKQLIEDFDYSSNLDSVARKIDCLLSGSLPFSFRRAC